MFTTAGQRTWLYLGIVLSLTFLAYANTLAYQFVYDDFNQIVINPRVQSWAYVPSYFTSHVWSQELETGSYYRPVFLLWLLVNFKLFSLSPTWWHFAAILLHLIVTAGLFWITAKLVHNIFLAAAAALLFGLHPAHLENVAWVSGATDPLLAIFLIASLLSLTYRRHRGPHSRWLYLASLFFFVLALLTKETAVVLPALVFVYCLFCFDQRHSHDKMQLVGPPEGVFISPLPPTHRFRRSLLATFPFVLVLAAYLAIRQRVLHGNMLWAHASLREAVLTVPAMLSFYLRHLLFPFRLAAFYDSALVTHPGFANLLLPLLLVAVMAVSVGLVFRKRREPATGFWLAVGLILLPLLPAFLGVFSLPDGDVLHDRYLYVPSAGFAILLALAVGRVLQWKTLGGMPASQLAIVALIALTYNASLQLNSVFWHDNLALFRHAVQVAPRNVPARQNLAVNLAAKSPYEAFRVFEQLLADEPGSWPTALLAAKTALVVNDVNRAESYTARARAIRPEEPSVLALTGLIKAREGDLGEAERLTLQAIRLAPQTYNLHLQMGGIYLLQGRLALARTEYETELRSNPQSVTARQHLLELDGRK